MKSSRNNSEFAVVINSEITWGNGVLYDADQEWTERKELVQMGLLKPELALAWKFDLPAETEADLAEIRKNYMPELKDLEG